MAYVLRMELKRGVENKDYEKLLQDHSEYKEIRSWIRGSNATYYGRGIK